MAETKTKQIEELNLDKKVIVKSIAGWDVGFARIDTNGDVKISPNGTTLLTRNEIISQVNSGNRLFTGLDGNGSHATLFIDDDVTRKEIGFDSEDGKTKQLIFNDTEIARIFTIKSESTFEDSIKDYVRVRAERYAVIQAIKRLGINDYTKIRFIEDYTGYKFQ